MISRRAKSTHLGAAACALVIAAVLLTVAAHPTPEHAALRTVAGSLPVFARSGSNRYGSSIHFAEDQGINCVLSGPNNSIVEGALSRGRSAAILCDFNPAWYQPPRVYSVSVDGRNVLSYDDTVRYEKRERLLGIGAAVVCLCLAGWYMRKAIVVDNARA